MRGLGERVALRVYTHDSSHCTTVTYAQLEDLAGRIARALDANLVKVRVSDLGSSTLALNQSNADSCAHPGWIIHSSKYSYGCSRARV